MAEKKTEASFEQRIKQLGYPIKDISTGDLKVWSQTEFSNSEEIIDKFLNDSWKHASKQKDKDGIGKPEYTIRKIGESLIIVVECKPNNEQHCSVDDFLDIKTDKFKEKLESKETTSSYAIDGVLHYAKFIKDAYDVLAVGVSGHIEVDKNGNVISNGDYRLTSFLWRKGTDLKDIILKDDGAYYETFEKFETYIKDIETFSPSYQKIKGDLQIELTQYANRCNSYLRKNDINPEVRVGYIAGCLIALEDKKFRKKVERSLEIDEKNRVIDFSDMIGSETSQLVNSAQETQWRKLPEYKKRGRSSNKINSLSEKGIVGRRGN